MTCDWFDRWGCFDEEGEIAVKISERELTDHRISAEMLRVLAVLRYIAAVDPSRLLNCSTKQIASWTRLGIPKIRKAINSLRELSYLDDFDGIPWLRGQNVGCVYFIQNHPGREIKIGRAVDPYRRLSTLSTGSPGATELIGILPGGADLERELHKRFAHLRLQGEWFSPGDDLLEFIGEIRNDPEYR